MRRAAIVCASIMLISCAALVVSLVTPHRPILAADLERSLLLYTALADAVPSPSILQREVRFTVLESNPIDSVLKKASASDSINAFMLCNVQQLFTLLD
jgi:hypothetical protein